MEREKVASAGQADFEPDFAGKEYLVERQLNLEARKDIVDALEKKRHSANFEVNEKDVTATAFSSELMHICRLSGTGCRVYEDRIPIDYQTAVMAEELNYELVKLAALNGARGTMNCCYCSAVGHTTTGDKARRVKVNRLCVQARGRLRDDNTERRRDNPPCARLESGLRKNSHTAGCEMPRSTGLFHLRFRLILDKCVVL